MHGTTVADKYIHTHSRKFTHILHIHCLLQNQYKFYSLPTHTHTYIYLYIHIPISTRSYQMSFQLQNSEVLARLKPFGILFEKSLNDLIKGIRAHSKESPESLAKFLDTAIQECKSELYTTDLETKAMAVLKLAYLEMYGFDMSWCNFQILEVMSSSKFQQKRIGYLAAIQSFKNEQDLLILATNQFKKDLNSSNHVEVGLALSGIATIVTQNLSRDIIDDVVLKLTHTKPYIRKKAILAMYKIFLQYPESLKMNFHRIIDKLDDPDVSVVSATVNVICEISKSNPKIFLNYLPRLFQILEETKNNWLIIRILKLFQSLSKIEPRMKKKILPTIIELMLRTLASSLIYECINCAVNGQMLSPESYKDQETARLCINQLMNFFKTRDSNLKFVGLLALINILKIYPVLLQSVDGVSDVVMDCLQELDPIIKRKALEISNYLVTEDNIVDVVKVMLLQLIPDGKVVDDNLKLEVTLKILEIASRDNYDNVPNFKWYVAVLKDIMNLTVLLKDENLKSSTMSLSSGAEIANALGKEFTTLATKVPSVRAYLLENVVVEVALDIGAVDTAPDLLKHIYWILGEYIDELKVGVNNNDELEVEDEDLVVGVGKKVQIFKNLLNIELNQRLVESLRLLAPTIISILIQTVVKIFNALVRDSIRAYSNNGELSRDKYDQLSYHLYRLIGFLTLWREHSNYEVQERAMSWLEFLKLCQEAMVGEDLAALKALEKMEKNESAMGNTGINGTTLGEGESTSEDSDIDSDLSDELSSESDDAYSNSDSDEQINSNGSFAFASKLSDNPFAGEYLAIEDDDIDDVGGGHDDLNKPNKNEISSLHAPRKLPMLVSHILPSFFSAFPLNPVSKNAQRNIPVPNSLDLELEIHPEVEVPELVTFDDSYNLYLTEHEVPDEPLIKLSSEEVGNGSKKLNRYKDDPFYLDYEDKSKKSLSRKSLTKSPSLDRDVRTSSSPTMSILSSASNREQSNTTTMQRKKQPKMKKEKVAILQEETIGDSGQGTDGTNYDESNLLDFDEPTLSKLNKGKKNNRGMSNLRIDSSSLAKIDFDLNLDSLVQPLESSNEGEYQIDLNALREKLASSSIEHPRKMGKEKKKKKKKNENENEDENEIEKESEKENEKLKMKMKRERLSKKERLEKLETMEAMQSLEKTNPKKTVLGVDKIGDAAELVSNVETPAVIAVKSKKKKSKKKAAIIE